MADNQAGFEPIKAGVPQSGAPVKGQRDLHEYVVRLSRQPTPRWIALFKAPPGVQFSGDTIEALVFDGAAIRFTAGTEALADIANAINFCTNVANARYFTSPRIERWIRVVGEWKAMGHESGAQELADLLDAMIAAMEPAGDPLAERLLECRTIRKIVTESFGF